MRSAIRSMLNALPAPLGMAIDSFQQRLRHADVRAARARRLELFRRAGSPTGVQAGPFKGMSLRFDLEQRNLLPILLGTYEIELHDAIEQLIALQPDAVINIGSAEGYFTIGMAMRLPGAQPIAFETRKVARYQLMRNASLNALADRIRQHGSCTPESLQQAASPYARPLVFCDCEGYEDVLLDPQRVPALARAIILVEVHDGPGFAPGVGDRLRERFAHTHDRVEIRERVRSAEDRPLGCRLGDAEFLEAINEERSLHGLWYVLLPHSSDPRGAASR